MLSDEERKAIEDLKDMIEKSRDLMEEEFYKLATIHNIQAVATVLNLIEKQSKEIEELKEVKWYYEISRVPKDKIKAKIEELDYNDIGNFERRCKQEVLQSLLEKE